MNSFSILSPENGKSFRVGNVIEANGRHSLDPNSNVWAILRDSYGNYYLQNPPVSIDIDGSWLSTNLHLGRDIQEIIFVQVTNQGNDVFLRKVKNREWGAFSSFPPGTKQLGRVRTSVR